MPKILASSFLRAGLVMGGLLFSLTARAEYHIVIDPGHGGRDRGATRAKIFESEIALKVSKLLEERLQNDERFKVSMTRQKDEFISLQNRAKFASDVEGDLFVSIHVNSSPDHKAHGAEFYFQNQLPPDEESIFLAARENNLDDEDEDRPLLPHQSQHLPSDLKPEVKTILLDLIRNHKIMDSSLLSKTLREKWKGEQRSAKNSIRQAPFYVVSQVPIPSVLIELGFLTHEHEAKKLVDPVYQNLIVKSIYDGLVTYRESALKMTP